VILPSPGGARRARRSRPIGARRLPARPDPRTSGRARAQPAQYLPGGEQALRRRNGQDRSESSAKDTRRALENPIRRGLAAGTMTWRGISRMPSCASGWRRRAAAGLFQEPSDLLRRTGQDAGSYASGAFGPTTATGWNSFVDSFQAAAARCVLAKGNAPPWCAILQEARRLYLGSIGGAAATSPSTASRRSRWWNPESGMEAIWRTRGVDFQPSSHRRQGQ